MAKRIKPKPVRDGEPEAVTEEVYNDATEPTKVKLPPGESVVETIPWPLSAEERADYALQAANLNRTVANLKAEFKDQAKSYREEAAREQNRLNHLLDCIRTGREDRELDLVKVVNARQKQTRYYLASTGELCFERAMTEQDRQMSFLRKADSKTAVDEIEPGEVPS